MVANAAGGRFYYSWAVVAHATGYFVGSMDPRLDVLGRTGAHERPGLVVGGLADQGDVETDSVGVRLAEEDPGDVVTVCCGET